MSSAPTAANSIWIRSPIFDLTFVMGGAILTLFAALVVNLNPHLLLPLFWIWVVGFEGSHFWATFSRTYFDKPYREKNKSILIGSLVFFIFPLAAVLLDQTTQAYSFKGMYGFFIFLWSLYHNARQHFGFLSIYMKKSGYDDKMKSQFTPALYFSVVAAQIFFLFNFKIQGAFNVPQTGAWNPNLVFLCAFLPKLISVGVLVYVLALGYNLFQKKGAKGIVPLLYVLTCLTFYSVMFYIVAPRDTFMQNPASGMQMLLLIAVMNSLFHNIQYHAIVWHYGQARYNSPEAQNNSFGPAKWINATTLHYIIVALGLGLVFGFIGWNVGDWPSLFGAMNSSAQSWAYILFFGIIGHHFYLDQKIWRPSQQGELKKYLNI